MRVRTLLLLMLLTMSPLAAMPAAAQPQPPKEFVPVGDAPQGEQIPAMPLLGAAYGFIWVAMFGYIWSLARRLQKVEAELTDLESRKK